MRMNSIPRWAKTGLVAAAVLLAAEHGIFARHAPSANSAKVVACTAPESRQFDFWVGDWDAFDMGNPATVVARTHVDRILDRCVLREDYQDTNGMKGQSFNIYDTSRKKWHQSWVTNRGRLLLLDGEFQHGEMVLSGTDLTADGKPRLVRGIWKAIDGGVRETAVTSINAGKTWDPWFDIVFRPHRP